MAGTVRKQPGNIGSWQRQYSFVMLKNKEKSIQQNVSKDREKPKGAAYMVAKRQITTMCPMNCLPTQCGMTVEVEGNKLLSLKGDKHNPDSQGFLCMRGRAAQEIFENPKRLLHPLRRVGERGEDRWGPCSWNEAYAMIV